MEWVQSTASVILGLIGGAIATYLWARGKLSTVHRQEVVDDAAAMEVADQARGAVYNRMVDRYEASMKHMEERHARQLAEQSELFRERYKDIDTQLKEQSNAMRLLHRENAECQERGRQMQSEIDRLRVEMDALKKKDKRHES